MTRNRIEEGAWIIRRRRVNWLCDRLDRGAGSISARLAGCGDGLDRLAARQHRAHSHPRVDRRAVGMGDTASARRRAW